MALLPWILVFPNYDSRFIAPQEKKRVLDFNMFKDVLFGGEIEKNVVGL